MKLLPEQTLWRDLELQPDSVIDGDTLRVRDPDPEAWGAQQARLRRNAGGEVVLRLAALDAPESHYAGGPADLVHQPPQATGLSMALLRSELAALPSARLCVRVCAIDRYGRALALVWSHDSGPRSERDCTPPRLRTSLNARLLASGAAFPDFHDDLPASWTAELADLAQRARLSGQGLWPLDRSRSGVAWNDRQGLAERDLVLPRLFRRIADFWRLQGELQSVLGSDSRGQLQDGQQSEQHRDPQHPDLAECFREFLEQRERPLRLRQGGPVRPFAELLELRAGRCRLTGQVENFLYQSCLVDQKLT